MHVSRETSAKKCSRCWRPRDRRGQRYCRGCQAIDAAEYRVGRFYVLLTAQEYEELKARRRSRAAPDARTRAARDRPDSIADA